MTTVAQIAVKIGLSGHFVQNLDDFNGQARAKEQLNVLISAAKRKGKRLPHLMFASGFAGLGKTNLAMLVAAEMDAEMIMLDPTIKPGDALQKIEILHDGAVVYMDEVHRGTQGGRGKLDWMLQAVENGIITTPLGNQALPDVTWIISTTDAGKLPESLLSRFTEVTLARYTDEEADKISVHTAIKVFDREMEVPHWDDVQGVARAANNNPRIIRRLWEAIADFYWSNPDANFVGGHYQYAQVLDWWGLTADGLTEQAVRYLKVMFKSFPDGAGGKAIADALHEPSGVSYTEQLLHDKGLIVFTRQGRMLTAEGRKRARDMLDEARDLKVAA